MNQEFWEKHYKKSSLIDHSPFAELVTTGMEGSLVDLGCGDGRDLNYFIRSGIEAKGVDASNEADNIIKQDVLTYMAENKAPTNVYARFFWHAITREEQLAVLDWTTENIYIEARTTKDVPKNVIGAHDRNLVDINQLWNDLAERGFEVKYLYQGYGLSVFAGEDPHLFRIVATRMV